MKRRTATIISPVSRGGFGTSVWRDERGVVVVITALTLTALVGMAALVVDLGWLYVVRGELQNAADAGALAGVVELANNGPGAAEDMAVSYATQSTQYHLTQPIPGPGAVDVSFPAIDRLRVKVGPITVPTFFAGVLGIATADVSAVAVAELQQVIGTGPGNLLPFGVSRDAIDSNQDGYYDLDSTIRFDIGHDKHKHHNDDGDHTTLVAPNAGAKAPSGLRRVARCCLSLLHGLLLLHGSFTADGASCSFHSQPTSIYLCGGAGE